MSVPAPILRLRVSTRAGAGDSGGFRVVHLFEGPLAGSMAERQLHAGVRRLDLEERSRPGDHRERGALVPHAQDFQDAEAATRERDLTRPAVEPIAAARAPPPCGSAPRPLA